MKVASTFLVLFGGTTISTLPQLAYAEDVNKCNNPQDIASYHANGGVETRATQSNFCSRTYNGGCFLDSDCIETCFQETYGYSSECSTCFGVIPSCSIGSGCMMVWYVEMFRYSVSFMYVPIVCSSYSSQRYTHPILKQHER